MEGGAPERTGLFWILVGASVLASLGSVPYLLEITSQIPGMDRRPAEMAGPVPYLYTALQSLVLSGLTAWAGLRLLPRTGLRVGVSPPGAGLRRGVTVGLALGVGLLGLAALLARHLPEIALRNPAWWKGLLASASAGVNEEIWFRLGVMTALIALGTTVLGRAPAWLVWVASAIAALLFGALHLPQAAAIASLTPAVVGFTLLGNGIAGIAFGWLYWKHGLVSAMVAHFATDVVLHVIAPLAER